MHDLSERRKHLRYPVYLPVSIYYQSKWAMSHTIDLGLGGMKLTMDSTLPAGEDFLFQMKLGKNPIWSKGRILSTQIQPGLGRFSCVQFIAISDWEVYLLGEFLSLMVNEAKKHSYRSEPHRVLSSPTQDDLSPGRSFEENHRTLQKNYGLLKEKYIDILLRKNLLQKDCHELELHIREREAELLKAEAALRALTGDLKQNEEALRKLEDRLHHLAFDFFKFQEKEKKMIAEEIQDSLGTILFAIDHGMENMISLMQGKLSGQLSFEQVFDALRSGVKRTQGVLAKLGPSVLDGRGILTAIHCYCQDFQNLYPEIRIEKELKIQDEDVSDRLKIVIFRVLQEALSNTSKHSQADLVTLSLRKEEDQIKLTILDNGRGFDWGKVSADGKGLGLFLMIEQVEFSGGCYKIESSKEAGTLIQASWPIVFSQL